MSHLGHLTLPLGALIAFAHAGVATAQVDAGDVGSVKQGYVAAIYKGGRVPTGWTGNVAGCVAGVESEASTAATISAVNFYRQLVGLPSVNLDRSAVPSAMAASLMMTAANSLDHYPPPTWPCYTTSGAEGAQRANLALGASGVAAISLYMVDPGANNTAVGHRRWILYPPATAFGTGSTWNANALTVIGSAGDRPTGGLVTWPPVGYVPWQLVPERWSFSTNLDPGADYTNARVKVTANGIDIPTRVLPVQGGSGDNTLVFEVFGTAFLRSRQTTFQVQVSGVVPAVAGGPTAYTYSSTAFPFARPEPPTSVRREVVSGRNVVRWRRSVEHGDSVTGYRVSLRGPTHMVMTVGPGIVAVSLPTLRPGAYSVRVLANSSLGGSEARGTSFRVVASLVNGLRVTFSDGGRAALRFRLTRRARATARVQRWDRPTRRWVQIKRVSVNMRPSGLVRVVIGAVGAGRYRVLVSATAANGPTSRASVNFER